MKLFKNKKSFLELIKSSSISEYLIELDKGLSLAEIAAARHESRQNVHQKFKTFFKQFEKAEPTIVSLCAEFDTYLNINKITRPYAINLLVRYMVLNNKKIATTSLLNGVLVDKKLKHQVERTKANKVISVVGRYMEILRTRVPISMEDFAKLMKLNDEGLREFFSEVVKDRTYIIKDQIVSARKGSLQLAILHFCEQCYDGKLYDLYEYIYEDIEHHLDREGLRDKEVFYFKLISHLQASKNTFAYREDDDSYELVKYLKKNSVPYLERNQKNNAAVQRRKKLKKGQRCT